MCIYNAQNRAARAQALLQLGRLCVRLQDHADRYLNEALEIDRQLNVFTSEQRAEIERIPGLGGLVDFLTSKFYPFLGSELASGCHQPPRLRGADATNARSQDATRGPSHSVAARLRERSAGRAGSRRSSCSCR